MPRRSRTARAGKRDGRARAERFRAAVKRIIDSADLEGLLSLGCPEDEYDPEIDRITARIIGRPSLSAQAIEDVIYDVWNEMFGPLIERRKSAYRKDFRSIAAALLVEIEKEAAQG